MAQLTPPDAEMGAVFANIATYYTAKVERFGSNHLGVDWPTAPGQALRFAQLLKVCPRPGSMSWNDIGCGYGALLGFLAERYPDTALDYAGADLSPAMIARARALWRKQVAASFVVGRLGPRLADYSVASGVFNVQLGTPDAVWDRFVRRTLEDMRDRSSKGMAVNFKALPPGGTSAQGGLYHTHPERWQRFCEHALGWSARLLTGYGLGEFTLLLNPPCSAAI